MEEADQNEEEANRSYKTHERFALKQKVFWAKCKRRWAKHLQKQIEAGRTWRQCLSPADQQVLYELESGKLLEDLNNAKREYGHGTLVSADGEELRIGGSTGAPYT